MPGHPIASQGSRQSIMLCLVHQAPSDSELTEFTLTQSPHQQRPAAGDSLNESTLRMIYKQAYPAGNVDDKTYVWDSGKPATLFHGEVKAKGPPVFMWGDNSSIRTLLFLPFAEAVFDSKKCTDPYPGAAMIGILLGGAIYKLEIRLNELMLDHAKTKPRLPTVDLPYVSPGPELVARP